MIEVFQKELNVKDYDCSFDGKQYNKLRVSRINVYVQVTKKCNAFCKFCKRENICEEFDFEKFELILKELSSKVIIGKVAITGGEPLMCLDKTLKVISIARKYCKVVNLNTNASFAKELELIYPFVDQIDISKHHYEERVQEEIMRIKTLRFEELKKYDPDSKVSINCVLQKGLIDNYDEMIRFLEYAGKYGIRFVKFISLLPLTKEAIKNYINPLEMIENSKKFTNSGMLYDHDMCHCFEFLYLTNSCSTIKVVIRHTTNSNYCCVKQFVFNGKNLFDGFAKNMVII